MNKYKVNILSNKIPLITVPIKGAPTATALVIIKTGSKYETTENNGISHFLEHMFFKGTAKRPSTLVLSSELDSLGGEYNAFTAKEFTGYWVKVAAPKLPEALDIVSDMLLNSKILPEEIEREKGVIIEELNMYEDNPMMHVEDVFESVLYGDTPAGWETIGTKKNISGFKHADFIKYLETQYGARSMYVVLVGGIKAEAKKEAIKMFSKFKANKWQDKPAVKENQRVPQMRIVYKKTDQVNLSLGVRALPIGHPDEFKIKLLSIILGGSMSSRLFINLRERNGLAYYVRTMNENYTDSGYLTTQAGVPVAKTEAAIKIILAEYKKLTTELVGAKELKRAKDLLQGKSLLQMEATDNLATWYARQAVLRKKMLTPGEFLKQINKVTANDLRAVAKKIFVNHNLNLAVIGKVKAEKFANLLKL
ncbi:MAG: pitrilysin family protein [Patescibacteria group bacterium]|jgi:predicted Zn-dependent peptidase